MADRAPLHLVGLRRRLYGLSFVDEFGPIYAVYTLWFNDSGLSAAAVSTVFVVWAVVALALEIPSGALADLVDRRLVLAAAFAIRAVGIGLWLVWPTLTGVIVGAILWAVHDALASGAWEAMIHDQLRAVGAADRYATVMARVGQFSNLGVAVGTIVGGALLRLDVALVVLGWATVAAHAGSIGLTLSLPPVAQGSDALDAEPDSDPDPAIVEPGRGGTPGERALGRPGATAEIDAAAGSTADGGIGSWWATLRRGVAQARTDVTIAHLVIVGALLEGLWLVDEFLPLVSRAQGGSDATAPVLILVVWVGLLVGGEVAARRPGLGRVPAGLAVTVGALVMLAGLASGRVWALGLVAVGYAAMEVTQVVANARLQERTDGDVRATVASIRGFGSAAISMLMLAAVGFLAVGDDPTPGLYLMMSLIGLVGLLVVRWLPRPAGDR